jgi:hypothetical protein
VAVERFAAGAKDPAVFVVGDSYYRTAAAQSP